MISRHGRPGRRLLLSGLPHFAGYLARRLAEEGRWRVRLRASGGRGPRLWKALLLATALARVDLWYMIGGSRGWMRAITLCKLLRVRAVIHWAGTDVSLAVDFYRKHPERIARLRRATHWAGAPWLAEELASIGVQSEFVPFPLEAVERALGQEPPPFPSAFTVLGYFPDARREFYGGDHVLRLAGELPSVRFLIAGATGAGMATSLPNVQYLGWVADMLPVYAQSTVVVRMPRHDGYGGTVQEALALGRHAVWTYPFPGARQASDYSTLRSHVVGLLAQHESGDLPLNETGRAYMTAHMSAETLIQGIDRRLRRALNPEEEGLAC